MDGFIFETNQVTKEKTILGKTSRVVQKVEEAIDITFAKFD